MRTYILILTLGLIGICNIHAETLTPEQLFYDGNEAYQNGHYAEAISLYQAASLEAQTSALHNNLASAHTANYQPGYGVLHFKKALALDPQNIVAQAGLKALLQEQGIGNDVNDSRFNSVYRLSFNNWTWLATGSFWTSLFLFIAIYYYKKNNVCLRILNVTSILVLIVASTCVGLRHQEISYAIVLENDSPLKVAPAHQAPAIAFYQAGETVSIQRETNNHYFISSPNKQNGWMDTAAIKKIWD